MHGITAPLPLSRRSTEYNLAACHSQAPGRSAITLARILIMRSLVGNDEDRPHGVRAKRRRTGYLSLRSSGFPRLAAVQRNDRLGRLGRPHREVGTLRSLAGWQDCQTQEEVDRLWRELSAGGQEVQCGWLSDKYGVSWQITPTALLDMLGSSDTAAAQRAFTAMMGMKKLDIAALQRAYDGG